MPIVDSGHHEKLRLNKIKKKHDAIFVDQTAVPPDNHEFKFYTLFRLLKDNTEPNVIAFRSLLKDNDHAVRSFATSNAEKFCAKLPDIQEVLVNQTIILNQNDIIIQNQESSMKTGSINQSVIELPEGNPNRKWKKGTFQEIFEKIFGHQP